MSACNEFLFQIYLLKGQFLIPQFPFRNWSLGEAKCNWNYCKETSGGNKLPGFLEGAYNMQISPLKQKPVKCQLYKGNLTVFESEKLGCE